jgi:uncharacterized repeat protein (TIGR01451 family)
MNVPQKLLLGLVLGVPGLALGAEVKPVVPATCDQPPLLYVRFLGPEGSRLSFYQGDPGRRDFPAPVTVGLRPGYIYRVQVTDLPKRPGIAFFPTLEVRGTLIPRPGLNPAEHPVPVVFSAADMDRVLSGAFLTKVIYLESPDQAEAIATKPDQPLETEVLPGRDLLEEARAKGRPLLVLRWGEREFDDAEMVHQSVAGTILLPSEPALAPPAAPPCLPWACFPFYDPKLGPRCLDEECFHDGGDGGLPAGIGPDGKLHGLDPADTVAEYTDSKGKRRIAISNRVCICAPRFAVMRTEIAPLGHVAVKVVAGADTVVAQMLLEERLRSRENRQIEAPEVLNAGKRPSAAESIQGLVITEQMLETIQATARVREADVVGVCPPPCPPDRPLVLCKWADKHAAHVGEVVTFYLRYTNTGGQPMTHVVVSDSLTNRLEYVPGSAVADRAATFTTQVNEVGSAILRWEFGGSLPAGQSGVVRFQARIR